MNNTVFRTIALLLLCALLVIAGVLLSQRGRWRRSTG